MLWGCRPDPAATAMAVPDRSEPPPRFAATGDTIRIDMMRNQVRARSTVATDGTIEAPLCGSLTVGGRQAHDICTEISACLGRYYRRAAVMVTIDGDAGDPSSSGCAIEGPAKADGWAEASRRLLAAAQDADDVDPRVLVRAADVASQYEMALTERTDEHPDVATLRTRVERLVQAATRVEGSGDPERARAKLAALIAHAERALAKLSVAYGPKHPERRAAEARRDLLVAVDAALPVGEVPEPSPVALAVERIEVAARLEHARAHLGPKHPERLALEARAEHFEESPKTPVPCDALLRHLDVRLARLEGRREAGNDASLDPIIDALAIARARTGRGLECQPATPPSDATSASAPASNRR